MTEIEKEVATAIARLWTSDNKNVDLNQAAILFLPSARAAIEVILSRTIGENNVLKR